jgi:hypothetical protein
MNDRSGVDAAALAPSDTEHVRPRPAWLTTPCPAWCDGMHDVADWGSDRVHMGRVGRVELMTMKFADYVGPGDEPNYAPQAIEIDLRQHYREAEPSVSFEIEAGGKDVPVLTLDEAQSFIHALAVAVVNELPPDQAKQFMTSLGVAMAGCLVEQRPEPVTPDCPPWCEEHNGGLLVDDGACYRDLKGQYGMAGMCMAGSEVAPRLWIEPANQNLTVDDGLELARDLLLQVAAARMERPPHAA